MAGSLGEPSPDLRRTGVPAGKARGWGGATPAELAQSPPSCSSLQLASPLTGCWEIAGRGWGAAMGFPSKGGPRILSPSGNSSLLPPDWDWDRDRERLRQPCLLQSGGTAVNNQGLPGHQQAPSFQLALPRDSLNKCGGLNCVSPIHVQVLASPSPKTPSPPSCLVGGKPAI